MRTTRSRAAGTALLAPLAALALLLGGCAGGADDAPEPEETSATPDESDEADDEADEPAEADGSSGGADCVAGTWVADTEAQAAATTSALGASDLGATATVTGEAITTFDGSTMTTEYRDQVITVEWGMEGQALSMVNSWSGTLTGTVEITDDQIVVSDVDPSGLEMSYETSINGEVVDIPGLADIPLSGMAAGGTSTYTCSGDRLEVTPVVEGVDTAGFVTVLHRR